MRRRAPVLIAVAAVLCVAGAVGAVTIGAPWSGGSGASTAGSSSPTTTGRPPAQFAADANLADPSSGSLSQAQIGGIDSTATSNAARPGSTGSATSAAAPTSAANPTTGSPAKAPALTSAAQSATPGSSTASTVPAAPAAPVAAPTSVNISANIAAVPSGDSTCTSTPTGAACTNAAITALDHARAVLGLPNYAIPAGFASLDAPHQLLVLSNLDRALYGLPAISGLNSTLNTAAQAGVTAGGDPTGVNVGTAQWQAWASNWASGYPNATFTYYAWMYDDGLGSPNADCTTTNSSGCWGHRLNTLHDFGSGVQIAMGAGFGGTAFTELYESFATSAVIAYS